MEQKDCLMNPNRGTESDSNTTEELQNTIVELKSILADKSNLELTYIKENLELKLKIDNYIALQEQLGEKISDAKDILSSFEKKYKCVKQIVDLGINLGEKFEKDSENIDHYVYLYKEKRRKVVEKLEDEVEKLKTSYIKLKEESANEAKTFRKQLEDGDNKIAEERNIIKNLQNELREMEQQKKNELAKLQAIRDETEEANIKLSKLREARERDAIKHAKKKQSYIDRISKLKEEIETVQESVQKSKLEIELKENASKNQDNLIKKLKYENSKKEFYITDMTLKIQNKRKEIDGMMEVKRKCTELQSKLLELENEITKLQDENVNLCRSSELIQLEITSNEERIKILEEKIIAGENSLKLKQNQLLEVEQLQNQMVSTHTARMQEYRDEIRRTKETNKCYLEEETELSNE